MHSIPEQLQETKQILLEG